MRYFDLLRPVQLLPCVEVPEEAAVVLNVTLDAGRVPTPDGAAGFCSTRLLDGSRVAAACAPLVVRASLLHRGWSLQNQHPVSAAWQPGPGIRGATCCGCEHCHM
jgi:hypothetical protein